MSGCGVSRVEDFLGGVVVEAENCQRLGAARTLNTGESKNAPLVDKRSKGIVQANGARDEGVGSDRACRRRICTG